MRRIFVIVGFLAVQACGAVLAGYTYDALGRRIVATIGGTTTRYYYDGQNVVEERDASENRLRYHVNGSQYIDERVCTYTDATGQFTYYLLKENYSVVGTGNADGSVVQPVDYSPTGSFAGGSLWFGVDYDNDGDVDIDDVNIFAACALGPEIAQASPACLDKRMDGDADVDATDFGIFQRCLGAPSMTPPPGCTDRIMLPSSFSSGASMFALHGRPVDILPDGHALLYVRARYYDLLNGRWLQRDRKQYVHSPNLYEGFQGNPTRFLDPDGELADELINLLLQGRFLSNEEVARAQGAGDYGLTNARSRLLRDIALAAGAVTDPGALSRLPRGFEEGYRQPAVRATTARLESFIFSQIAAGAQIDEASSNTVLTALFLGDMTGVTALGEGVFGVDLATNQTLTTGESIRRSVQGGSTIVIIVAGPQAVRNASTRSAALRQAITGEAASTLPRPLTVLNPEFAPNAPKVLQNLVNEVNARLAADPTLAKAVLSRPEYLATTPRVARMSYGKAVEEMVAREIRTDPLLRQIFNPSGIGARGPDILGVGGAQGLRFEVTTSNIETIQRHLSRPYGQNLIIITYDRPPNFTVFP